MISQTQSPFKENNSLRNMFLINLLFGAISTLATIYYLKKQQLSNAKETD